MRWVAGIKREQDLTDRAVSGTCIGNVLRRDVWPLLRISCGSHRSGQRIVVRDLSRDRLQVLQRRDQRLDVTVEV